MQSRGDRIARRGQISVLAHEARPVRQDRQAGRAACLIGAGQGGGGEIGPDQAARRAGLLDLGDQGEAPRRMSLHERAAESARRAGQPGRRLHRVPRAGRLTGRDLLALIGGDLVQDIRHLERSNT